MAAVEDVRVSSAELQEVAAQLRRQGKSFLTLDGDQVADRESFVEELRRVVQLDPPLSTGRSLDAIADSLFGGLAVMKPSAVLWDKAWVLGEADAEELRRLLHVLVGVRDQLAAHRPAGASVSLKVFAAVIARQDEGRAPWE